MYANAIRVVLKGYLPISLLPPMKLKKSYKSPKKAIQISNPDYDIVIKTLHLYYDMKLVTFGINEEKNLIVQFPVFVQPYTQQQLILYQIEMAAVPIIDHNAQTHFYTHLWVDRPFIALNSETYISLQHQELRMCKDIGYEFYCEELFVVKHKSKYSCETATYFDLGSDIIKENCNFVYIFNKTNIIPAVLDCRHEIILCNCEIEVENHFLLEYLAAWHDTNSKLIMYFMVNTAFVNYLDNLTNSLHYPLLMNRTTHEQILPISLQSFDFDTDLLKAPKTLKGFVHQFQHKKRNF